MNQGLDTTSISVFQQHRGRAGIQTAVLDGRQPPDLTLERTVRAGVPLDWAEQERIFGFSG